MNHAGVRALGRVMQRELDGLGLQTEWVDMPEGMNRPCRRRPPRRVGLMPCPAAWGCVQMDFAPS